MKEEKHHIKSSQIKSNQFHDIRNSTIKHTFSGALEPNPMMEATIVNNVLTIILNLKGRQALSFSL
jgi:hypothetical protein